MWCGWPLSAREAPARRDDTTGDPALPAEIAEHRQRSLEAMDDGLTGHGNRQRRPDARSLTQGRPKRHQSRSDEGTARGRSLGRLTTPRTRPYHRF